MEKLAENKLVWIIGALFLVNIFAIITTRVMVERTASRVMEMLEREYSPAKPPYGPGVNPDKIDLRLIKRNSGYETPDYRDQDYQPRRVLWQNDWEKSRFTP